MKYASPAPHQALVSPFDQSHNARLWAEFQAARTTAQARHSHYFGGRFENLYLPEALVPALAPVLRYARAAAQSHLGLTAPPRLGFWFNAMAPGESTLAHTHDDDDECLSGVYYVRVPADSGDLLLGEGVTATRIVPVPGILVLFPPDLVHEVTVNRSEHVRLSIGMNFGPATTD
ncbi:MAG: hypothetical protein ACFCUG_15210 [Thiotrichales bacterium]